MEILSFGQMERASYSNKKSPEAFASGLFIEFLKILNQFRLLQCFVCTILIHSSESLSRNVDSYEGINFRNEDALLLNVWSTTNFAARVKLRRTSAVWVAATNLGGLTSDLTYFCHTWAPYYHRVLILQSLDRHPPWLRLCGASFMS